MIASFYLRKVRASRPGWQLTTAGGDPKESATENKQQKCDRWNSRLRPTNHIGNYMVV